MKRLFSASGAVGYLLLSGFVLIMLLLAVARLGQEEMKEGERVLSYAIIASS